MEKYISGKKLIERWDIKGFQIFEIIKNGLNPCSEFGKSIVDRSSLTFKRKESKAEILKRLKIEQGSYRTQFIAGPGIGHRSITAKLTNEELDEQAEILFKKQPINIPIVPKDCVAEDLSLPVDEKKAALKIQEAMKYLFKLDSVQEYESKYFLQPVNESSSKEKMNSNESYPTLNIGELKHYARKWAMTHTCIKEIYLYRFALLADSLKYLIVTVGPEFPSKKTPEDEKTWTDEDVENNKIIRYYK